MRREHTLTADYFEELFATDPDPWSLESSPYEAQKFEDTIKALDGRHYHNALEIGCAGGMLTTRLAAVCDALLAVDLSATALRRAILRCAHLSNVRFERRGFPNDAPTTSAFDLIVLSEVAYYWDAADTEKMAQWLASALLPGGDLLLVHWLGETDYPQSGDAAVEGLRQQLKNRVTVVRQTRPEPYRLDLWRAV